MKPDLLDIPVPCRQVIEQLKLGKSSDYASASVVLYIWKSASEESGVDKKPTPLKASEQCLHHEIISAGCNADGYKPSAGNLKMFWISKDQKVGVVGCGEKVEADSVLAIGNAIGQHLATANFETCSIACLDEMANGIDAQQLGVLLHRLFFNLAPNKRYKGTPKSQEKTLKTLHLHFPQISDEEIHKAFERARKVAGANVFGAALIDAPPNYCNCQSFVAAAREEAKKYPTVEVKVLDENQCKEMKMGAFLAVAQGSRFGARLLHLVYKNGQPKQRYALVGKGITLDSGGYGIKPAQAMSLMKIDMSGAAVVTSSLLAAAAVELKDVEIHAISVLCENMVDKDAYRPGDVVTASNGKTIEVAHTDAEGRLALADGLVYAQKQLGNPGEGIIIDVATLTGAIMTALGDKLVAVYSNRDQLREEVVECMKKSGQPGWPMPLEKSYEKHIEGEMSDLKNSNFGWTFGGSITASLFLQNFVHKKTPWVHLDISGPLWANCTPGWGVEFFTDFLSKSSHRSD